MQTVEDDAQTLLREFGAMAMRVAGRRADTAFRAGNGFRNDHWLRVYGRLRDLIKHMPGARPGDRAV